MDRDRPERAAFPSTTSSPLRRLDIPMASSASSPEIQLSLPASIQSNSNTAAAITPAPKVALSDREDGETLSNFGHLPARSRDHSLPGNRMMPEMSRGQSVDRRGSMRPRSGIDWIVPLDDKPAREKTVGERLDPTLLTAIAEKEKYAFKAKMTGWSLNVAIGMQVVLGAMTTGLSVVTTGRQTSIMTAILGGFSTIVASYLARCRGSNEPELSITRVKDLEQFIRECEAFKLDRGHVLGEVHDDELETFRRRFEALLGNENGERRLSPPA